MLWRDLRAGELTMLGLAMVLAVAALSSVDFLADRMEQALQREAHQLLGGDLLLTADHPWRESFREHARAEGLRLAESVTFPSMVQVAAGGDREGGGEGGAPATQLVEIKAVSKDYPLRGALRLAPTLNAADQATAEIPAHGHAWADERLTTTLNLARGSRLALGQMQVTVDAVLTLEPDRGIQLFAIAPRLLIDLADLPRTGLLQAGSRASYRLHLAGEPAAVARFQRWAETSLGRGEKIESLDNARPEVRNLLERAQRFLRLASLLAVVLAAVAVALASERFLRRHLDGCAVMRTLGAQQSQLVAIFGSEFLIFGLLATLLGGALGYLVHLGLLQFVGDLLLADAGPQSGIPGVQGTSAPSFRPWLHGFAVGMTLVAGFVLPPLMRLRHAPPLRVLRREMEGVESTSLAAYALGGGLLAALMVWLAGELRLGAIVLGGFVLALVFFAAMARVLVAVLGRFALRTPRTPRGGGNGWGYGFHLGLANLRRHLSTTVVQAVALALGLTALLLFVVVRGDLLASWQRRVPPDAPNRFVINIQPDQRAAIADFFLAYGLPAPSLAPMVRGRLVAVNGQPITAQSYADERAQRLVDREFNLSWAAELPAGNRISAGRWPGARAVAEFSVEQGLAETLGLRLGDRLEYDIAGQHLAAPVTSLRALDWDSMRVNFFVMAPPGQLDGAPTTFITSFYLPPERGRFIPQLIQAFPNLTVIDVAAVLRQLDATLDQVVHAVLLVFGFAVLAGLAVLVAALLAGSDERRQTLAILRALGARRRQLTAALIAEFFLLGGLAGTLAGVAASLMGWSLAQFVFHLDYLPHGELVLIGALAGGLLTVFAAWWTLSPLLRQPAIEALRA
ncbi:MAG: ABC transporter permease [Betaproteobacteria bacterium HGW-Betaproteobacteria-11]|nr:MAG: ABC transporter permease [Betaproteobacteria bacterium HGW-Betaproteobacteria-11]